MTVLVGREAPDFTAPAVVASGEIVNQLNFSKQRNGRYAAIIFYPLDFTFVCPSELIALNKRVSSLEALDVEIFSVSIDSQYTHLAWRNTPVNNGGIGDVAFSMVSDVSHSIIKNYGIESPNDFIAYRSTFLVDRQGIVRHQVVNDLPLGRNMDELVRMVEALRFYEKNGEVCPAGWQKGEKGMTPSRQGVANFLSRQADNL